MPRFLDFHLIVNQVAGDDADRFVTAVAECPALRFGESLGQFTIRKSDLGLWQTEGVPLAFRRDADLAFHLTHQAAAEWPLSPEDIGSALFRLLFPPRSDSLDLLGRSCELLGRDDFLRVKLELHRNLVNLPWELLECPLDEKWTAQVNRANLSIIRYLGSAPRSAATDAGGLKPSILIIKANPEEYAQPEVTESLERELKNLRNALDRLAGRVVYHVIDEGPTLGRLVQIVHQLRSTSPVIGLHFMGHGWVDERGGFFAGEDEEGGLLRIYARDLRNVLIEAPAIRWVILNACWTGNEPFGSPLAGLATSLALLKDIPTVIAYQRPVETKDAEMLASDFYEWVLGDGRPVEEVIRSVKSRSSTPGGLLVLARAVEGRIQDVIHLAEGPVPARPSTVPEEPRAQVPRAPASPPPGLGGMVLVPAGPFQKGLTPEQIESLLDQFEKADRAIDLSAARKALGRESLARIELPAFRIDKTLVTNAQFGQFVDATRYRTDAERAGDPRNWRLHDIAEKAGHPVVYVSFHDAEAYCRWAGKRLPTADQWKKACRGEDARVYPWGNSFDPERCNSSESRRGGESTPVDRFPGGASPYGCLDLVGNVEEWTVTSPGDGKRAILGGSWAMTCRIYGLAVLQRLALSSFYSNDLGFRCIDETLAG